MSVTVKDNTQEILSALEKAKKRGLKAIGMAAERHAKKDPNMPVDTGRARNSITWATKEREGEVVNYKDDNGVAYSEQIGQGAEKDAVYIGSNVEYFPEIELGSRTISARHVLQRAATEHTDEYKKLLQESFENA